MILWLAKLLMARNPALTLAHAQRTAKVLLIFLAAAVLIAGFLLWLAHEKREAIEADRNAAKAEAVSRAREADEGAQRASESTREGIEDGNERAREAAGRSDDPLGDGLRSLRAETNRDRQATGRAY